MGCRIQVTCTRAIQARSRHCILSPRPARNLRCHHHTQDDGGPLERPSFIRKTDFRIARSFGLQICMPRNKANGSFLQALCTVRMCIALVIDGIPGNSWFGILVFFFFKSRHPASGLMPWRGKIIYLPRPSRGNKNKRI